MQKRKKTPTRAKKRMDKLLQHLTAEPAPSTMGDSPSANTPRRRQELRRELASAQRDRLLVEYGYELHPDEAYDPLIQVADDREEQSQCQSEGKKRLKVSSSDPAAGSSMLSLARAKLAKACRLVHEYGVAGLHAADDSLQFSFLDMDFCLNLSDFGFDEVSPDRLVLTKSIGDLPKLHSDLYLANPGSSSLFVYFRHLMTIASWSPYLRMACSLFLRMLCESMEEYGEWMMRTLEPVRPGRPIVMFAVGLSRIGEQFVPEGRSSRLWRILCTQHELAVFRFRALAAVGGDLSRLDIPSESEAIRARTDLLARCSDEVAAESLFKKL